ncbi:mitochondrial tryptophanyl-tRNA synthetase [Scheffersomyces amazonensis]|uniref:mitochondrial tryptophanyl-tRNA synthetase n=1 Tax=Scheffersomyces amazonensis TaxID=1078765 RepID=UPI00315CDC11
MLRTQYVRSLRSVRAYSSTKTGSVLSTKSVQTIQGIEKFPTNSTIFSLIQPTGKIHLGNYLGAIRSWKDLSEIESEGTRYLFGTADLHAITVPKQAQQLKQYRVEAIASLIASGLDVTKCTLFHQSSVPEHTELNWYLTTITSMGMLNRMTQWKSKANQEESSSIFEEKVLEKTKAGLLCYPVLQAADILIYRSTHVPVGDDQSQHLELTRNIASSFNHVFGKDYFPIPKTLLTPAKKILSLRNPSKKMSKSDPDQNSCVYVTESPDEIAKKIRKATTDSIQGKLYYDPEQRPGVSNLINIISGLTRKSIDDTVTDLQWVKDHKQLKDQVTELLVEEFNPKRHLYEQLLNDKPYLDKICREGTDKAREIASVNIGQIRALIGLD